jgi:integrase
MGLLASTGIRIGEALRLHVSEVQLELDPPRLQIAQTKFHKSRWVPLHFTTATQLGAYRTLRTQRFADHAAAPFFLSATGHLVNHCSLVLWFSKTYRRLGFWPTDGARRPCLHSLRHTFAVRRVLRWYEDGADVHGLLPHLSVYLGHVRPQESYWYLIATPELLTQAALRFQAYILPGGEQ